MASSTRGRTSNSGKHAAAGVLPPVKKLQKIAQSQPVTANVQTDIFKTSARLSAYRRNHAGGDVRYVFRESGSEEPGMHMRAYTRGLQNHPDDLVIEARQGEGSNSMLVDLVKFPALGLSMKVHLYPFEYCIDIWSERDNQVSIAVSPFHRHWLSNFHQIHRRWVFNLKHNLSEAPRAARLWKHLQQAFRGMSQETLRYVNVAASPSMTQAAVATASACPAAPVASTSRPSITINLPNSGKRLDFGGNFATERFQEALRVLRYGRAAPASALDLAPVAHRTRKQQERRQQEEGREEQEEPAARQERPRIEVVIPPPQRADVPIPLQPRARRPRGRRRKNRDGRGPDAAYRP